MAAAAAVLASPLLALPGLLYLAGPVELAVTLQAGQTAQRQVGLVAAQELAPKAATGLAANFEFGGWHESAHHR